MSGGTVLAAGAFVAAVVYFAQKGRQNQQPPGDDPSDPPQSPINLIPPGGSSPTLQPPIQLIPPPPIKLIPPPPIKLIPPPPQPPIQLIPPPKGSGPPPQPPIQLIPPPPQPPIQLIPPPPQPPVPIIPAPPDVKSIFISDPPAFMWVANLCYSSNSFNLPTKDQYEMYGEHLWQSKGWDPNIFTTWLNQNPTALDGDVQGWINGPIKNCSLMGGKLTQDSTWAHYTCQ